MVSYTLEQNFYGVSSPRELVTRFGSPLYVYNEKIIRARCRDMKQLVSDPGFQVDYSCKANSNLELLRIIHEEGIWADAMSPGEILLLETAGFAAAEIFFVPNNVAAAEMEYALAREIGVSVDSLSQLAQYGRLNPGGAVAVRFNPGIGLGHHEKVKTAGSRAKFGVAAPLAAAVKAVAAEFKLRIIGINQHLGSLFLEGTDFLEGARRLLEIAAHFEDLQFIDFGGGMGIPYQKQAGQNRLDLAEFGARFDRLLQEWRPRFPKDLRFKIEPGRYIVAECGVLLGTVHAVKESYGTTFVGTDLGFNVLSRPVMYNSHHDIEVYPERESGSRDGKTVTVVGNICESGDILAQERRLPPMREGDLIGVMDAGAYGFAMASNYNNRLRPAEVLVRADGRVELIRRRESPEDLLRCFPSIVKHAPASV